VGLDLHCNEISAPSHRLHFSSGLKYKSPHLPVKHDSPFHPHPQIPPPCQKTQAGHWDWEQTFPQAQRLKFQLPPECCLVTGRERQTENVTIRIPQGVKLCRRTHLPDPLSLSPNPPLSPNIPYPFSVHPVSLSLYPNLLLLLDLFMLRLGHWRGARNMLRGGEGGLVAQQDPTHTTWTGADTNRILTEDWGEMREPHVSRPSISPPSQMEIMTSHSRIAAVCTFDMNREPSTSSTVTPLSDSLFVSICLFLSFCLWTYPAPTVSFAIPPDL